MSMTRSNSDEKNCLFQILTCLICQQKAAQAHICPNCSKFYCYSCISIWIQQNDNKCPYCLQKLQTQQLINCQNLCSQLSNAIQTISTTTKTSKISLRQQQQQEHRTSKKVLQSKQYCQEHQLKRNYYCKTCQTPVCSDCSVISQKHKGHQFVRLSIVKKQNKLKVRSFKDQIQTQLKEIQKCRQLLDVRKDNHKTEQITSAILKLEEKNKNLKTRLNKKFHQQIQKLEEIILRHKLTIEEGDQAYDQCMSNMKQCPKVKFLQIESNLMHQSISKLLQKSQAQKKNNQILMKTKYDRNNYFESQVLPHYRQHTFTINNYTEVCFKKQMIYTDVFSVDGLQWRLKIYPCGNSNFYFKQNANKNQTYNKIQQLKLKQSFKIVNLKYSQEFLSIFIEFKKGLRLTGRYGHKIRIQSTQDSNKKIQRQFQSEFQTGECWGYDKFTKVSQLYQQGYIDLLSDSLKITLFISPSNFYQATLDQKQLYRERLNVSKKNKKQIRKLKEQLQLIKHKKAQSQLVVQNIKLQPKTMEEIQHQDQIRHKI